MLSRYVILLGTLTALTGCAADTAGITTSSVDPKTAAASATASKVDPACVTLQAQIDTLNKEGVSDRVEKAAGGKSKSVSLPKAQLVKMAELNKANAEFQAKCSTLAPRVAEVQPKS